MTAQQLILMICPYSVALVAVVYFTRATPRRIMGAFVGGASAGLAALGMIALGETMGWWRIPLASTPYFLLLLYLALAVSCSPIYLVSWRVARCFGWRGLSVFASAAAVVGPPRDYLFAAKYPEWVAFAPGAAPILAVSVTYLGIVVLGHTAMRLVAGAAGQDQLARRPKKTA